MFLMLMLDKLIKTVDGEREPDDRDHVSNKRCETAGILIGDIFRSLYKRFVRSLAPHLQKRREIIIAISRNNSQITQGFDIVSPRVIGACKNNRISVLVYHKYCHV